MFTYSLPVRYADTDAQGHVFFANYLTYFDEALTYFLVDRGCPYSELESLGLEFVFADAHCQYRGSARFADRVRIEVRVLKLGRTSLTTAYRALRGDDVLAEGELVQVCVDRDNHRPQPLPDRLRDALEA